MTIRTFGYAVDVSEEFLKGHPDAAGYVHETLLRKVDTVELRGPRGGRYERIGDLFGFDDGVLGDGYIRRVRTFIAMTKGRYVRPKR